MGGKNAKLAENGEQAKENEEQAKESEEQKKKKGKCIGGKKPSDAQRGSLGSPPADEGVEEKLDAIDEVTEVDDKKEEEKEEVKEGNDTEHKEEEDGNTYEGPAIAIEEIKAEPEEIKEQPEEIVDEEGKCDHGKKGKKKKKCDKKCIKYSKDDAGAEQAKEAE